MEFVSSQVWARPRLRVVHDRDPSVCSGSQRPFYGWLKPFKMNGGDLDFAGNRAQTKNRLPHDGGSIWLRQVKLTLAMGPNGNGPSDTQRKSLHRDRNNRPYPIERPRLMSLASILHFAHCDGHFFSRCELVHRPLCRFRIESRLCCVE
jgi:hypothetical protein